MFDAGFLEMLLLGVIALLVVGPERLPGLASKAGRMVAQVRRFIATTRSDIERELQAEELRGLLNKQEEEIRELRDIMKQNTDDLRDEMRETESLVDEFSRDASAELSGSADKLSKPRAAEAPATADSAAHDEKASS